MELIKPQKGTNYNIENDIQNLTSIEQEFEQIDNKITNDITSSIDELKDKVDNDITTAITELDNKVDTEIVTAIDNLETKVNTEISESITALDNKVTTSLQEQAESLKKEISDQIAKVVANSPEDFDTLKEISDWISGHSSDASTMNSAISGNTSAINQEISDRQAADTALQTSIDKKADKDLSNITGILAVANGGTGCNNSKEAIENLITATTTTMGGTITDNEYIVMQEDYTKRETVTKKKVYALWDYIKSKIGSVLGLTNTDYSGNAATATKATQDGSGNNIVNTYAKKSETPKTATFTMVGLGFKKDSVTSVRKFAQTIVSKYGSVGVLKCDWASANQGYVGSSTNKVLLSGGILLFTAKGNINSTWTEFTALYTSKPNSKTTLIACSIGDDATEGKETWTVVDYLRKTDIDSSLNSTSTNPVQNKVVNTALGNKVDKVSGKGLSTNDYTTTEKNKLAGIESGANKTTIDSALSSSSTNPVQNKVIYSALDNKVDKNSRMKIPTSAPSSPQAGDIWIG